MAGLKLNPFNYFQGSTGTRSSDAPGKTFYYGILKLFSRLDNLFSKLGYIFSKLENSFVKRKKLFYP